MHKPFFCKLVEKMVCTNYFFVILLREWFAQFLALHTLHVSQCYVSKIIILYVRKIMAASMVNKILLFSSILYKYEQDNLSSHNDYHLQAHAVRYFFNFRGCFVTSAPGNFKIILNAIKRDIKLDFKISSYRIILLFSCSYIFLSFLLK